MARYIARGEPVRFRLGNAQAGACFYVPALRTPQPALLFIHDRSGADPQALGIAERYARVGYPTLAVDLFQGEPYDSPADVEPFSGALNDSRVAAHLLGAAAWLKTRPNIRFGRLGVIGVGTGGNYALMLAASGDVVQAAIDLDGDAATAAHFASQVRVPVQYLLALSGAGASPEVLGRLRDALSASEVPHEIQVFREAGHGFFNERRAAFHFQSAEDAWSRSNKFLYRYLGEPGDAQ